MEQKPMGGKWEKQNRRSHLFIRMRTPILGCLLCCLSCIAHVLVVSLACPRAQWPAQQFRVSRHC